MVGMIERVARSLARSAGGKITGPSRHRASDEFPWDANHTYMEKFVAAHWKEHVHAAQFAIQAMREPTLPMVEAGMDYDEKELNIRLGRAPTVEECQIGEWQAMIDVALSEETQ